MKSLPKLTDLFSNITIAAVGVFGLIYMVVYAVLFVPGVADPQLKTITVQTILLALAVLTGYYFNSSADQAKKDEPPKPSTTTTTTVIPPDGETPKPSGSGGGGGSGIGGLSSIVIGPDGRVS